MTIYLLTGISFRINAIFQSNRTDMHHYSINKGGYMVEHSSSFHVSGHERVIWNKCVSLSTFRSDDATISVFVWCFDRSTFYLLLFLLCRTWSARQRFVRLLSAPNGIETNPLFWFFIIHLCNHFAIWFFVSIEYKSNNNQHQQHRRKTDNERKVTVTESRFCGNWEVSHAHSH